MRTFDIIEYIVKGLEQVLHAEEVNYLYEMMIPEEVFCIGLIVFQQIKRALTCGRNICYDITT